MLKFPGISYSYEAPSLKSSHVVGGTSGVRRNSSADSEIYALRVDSHSACRHYGKGKDYVFQCHCMIIWCKSSDLLRNKRA